MPRQNIRVPTGSQSDREILAKAIRVANGGSLPRTAGGRELMIRHFAKLIAGSYGRNGLDLAEWGFGTTGLEITGSALVRSEILTPIDVETSMQLKAAQSDSGGVKLMLRSDGIDIALTTPRTVSDVRTIVSVFAQGRPQVEALLS